MTQFRAVARKYHLMKIFLIIIGTGIMAFGIQTLYDPASLVTGGFSGLAIIVKYVTGDLVEGGIPLWVTNLVLNIPVFVIAYFVLGRRFIGKTLFGTVMLSAWLAVIPSYDVPQGDLLIAAVFGGLFSGGGIGLVLRANATTGGTDMVAAIFQKKLFRHYNVAQVMQVIDGLVVVVGCMIFGIRPTMYAIIAIFVTTQTSDMILEGFKFSRAVYIISDQHEELAKQIMEELDRGMTGLKAKGMYTQDEKCVLYCVVSKKQIPFLQEIVADIDPKAFVIVSDVREVLGEGFQEYQK